MSISRKPGTVVGSVGDQAPFYVEEALRHQGIGRALLERRLLLADTRWELERLKLSVFADNTSALHLYQSLGFTIERSERRCHDPEHPRLTKPRLVHLMRRSNPAPKEAIA